MLPFWRSLHFNVILWTSGLSRTVLKMSFTSLYFSKRYITVCLYRKLLLRIFMYLWLLEILDLIFVHYAGRVRNISLLGCLTNIRYRQPSSSAIQIILIGDLWYVLSALSHDFLGCCMFLFLVHICLCLCLLFLHSCFFEVLIFQFYNSVVGLIMCLWSFLLSVWIPLTCCELNCVLFPGCSRKLALTPRC